MNISKKILLIVSLPLILVSGSVSAGKKGKKSDNRTKLTANERKAAKEQNEQKKTLEALEKKTEQLKVLQKANEELEQIQEIGNDWIDRFQKITTLLGDEKKAQRQLGLTHIEIQEKNKTGEIPQSTLESLMLDGGNSSYINYTTSEDILNSPNATAEQIQIKLLGSSLKNLTSMNEIELNRLLRTAAFFMQSKNEAIKLYGTFVYNLVKISLLSIQKKNLESNLAQWKECEKSEHPIFRSFFKKKNAVGATLNEKDQFEKFILLIQEHIIDGTQTKKNELNQKIDALKSELSCTSDDDAIDGLNLPPVIMDTDLEAPEFTGEKFRFGTFGDYTTMQTQPISQDKVPTKHPATIAAKNAIEHQPALPRFIIDADFETPEITGERFQFGTYNSASQEELLSTIKDNMYISEDNRWLVKIETPWADYIFYKLCPQQEPTQLDLPQFTYDETPGRPGSYVGVWEQERPEWQEPDQSCNRVTRRNIAHKLFKAIPHIADYLLESDDLIFEGTYKDRRDREIATKSMIGCIVPKTITEDGTIKKEQGIDCVYEWGFIPTTDSAARPICYHRCARAVPSAMQLEREVLSRETMQMLPENWDRDAEFPGL